MTRCRILLIGYGNPGRCDDGLGVAVAEQIEKMNISGVTVEADYQLTIEDAAAIAEHEVVIFADASLNGPEPFSFGQIEPKASLGFSSHSIEPCEVLSLAHSLFGSTARGYVLAVRGYEFNRFGQYLSEKAVANLGKAVNFMESALRSGDLDFAKIVAQGPHVTV